MSRLTINEQIIANIRINAGTPGPEGPTGENGVTGDPGADGADGLDGLDGAPGDVGAPGSVWYQAAGAPGGGTGVNGDFYLNITNGDVYVKTAGAWGASVGNIKGPAGAGVVVGGATGQILQKNSGADFDTIWHTLLFADLGAKPTTIAGYGIIDAQPLDADLTALAALSATGGMLSRTGAGAFTQRTLTSGTGVTVTNGDGVAGAPSFAVDTTIVCNLGSAQTFAGIKTFTDTTCVLRNPANTFSTTIKSGATTGNRTVTLPNGTVSLMALSGVQTLTGTLTISADCTFTSATIDFQPSSNIVTFTSCDIATNTAGFGLSVKEGANAKMGTATLVGGTVVVNTNKVTATSRIQLTGNSDGGTPGWLRVSARTAGTSFTITSSSIIDTSTVAWLIVEPTP